MTTFQYSNLRLFRGIIVKRNGPEVAAAESITYNIRSIEDDEKFAADGVKPVRRFDPTDEIRAANVGELVWVQTQPGIAPLVYLFAPEEPTAGDCTT